MPTRSIGVSGIGLKKKGNIDEILKQIDDEFGERFTIEVEDDLIWVHGDLHNYKTINRLYEIIKKEKVSG